MSILTECWTLEVKRQVQGTARQRKVGDRMYDSFVVGENVPMWARSLGATDIRNEKTGKLERLLMPSGIGDSVVSANVGDTIAVVDGIATVIKKDIAKEYKM